MIGRAGTELGVASQRRALPPQSNSVQDLKIGDSVFGVCEAGQEGAYAEKIAVKAAIIAQKPDGLSHVNAAAVALTGLTALSAIEETLKLRAGESILIQGPLRSTSP